MFQWLRVQERLAPPGLGKRRAGSVARLLRFDVRMTGSGHVAAPAFHAPRAQDIRRDNREPPSWFARFHGR
jgi:hypothetical protein